MKVEACPPGEDMTDGTITPEVQIKQLEEALATETDRLQKLFAAYETQEKELVDAKAEIEVVYEKTACTFDVPNSRIRHVTPVITSV